MNLNFKNVDNFNFNGFEVLKFVINGVVVWTKKVIEAFCCYSSGVWKGDLKWTSNDKWKSK